MKIGVLALQGDYQRHKEFLNKSSSDLSLDISEVRSAGELSEISGLVIPGGESSALLKLLDLELETELKLKIKSGLPVFSTCAGVIFLAAQVSNPQQGSLGLIDIDIERNSYGRQNESFIEKQLVKTKLFSDKIETLQSKESEQQEIEGVFIRAPRITRVGLGVSILLEQSKDPVLVEQGNILAATFHPELSEYCKVIADYYLECVKKYDDYTR